MGWSTCNYKHMIYATDYNIKQQWETIRAPHHSWCRSDPHRHHPGSFSFGPQLSSSLGVHVGHPPDHWHHEQDQYQTGWWNQLHWRAAIISDVVTQIDIEHRNHSEHALGSSKDSFNFKALFRAVLLLRCQNVCKSSLVLYYVYEWKPNLSNYVVLFGTLRRFSRQCSQI